MMGFKALATPGSTKYTIGQGVTPPFDAFDAFDALIAPQDEDSNMFWE
jgi:hypothetical protein